MIFLVVSCEHGGNRIPPPYRYLFQSERDRVLLDSHRGFDLGALVMARALAEQLAAPLVTASVSRLLVDLNRSLGNPRVFSPAVRAAPDEVRQKIVAYYYRPYRRKVEHLIRQGVGQGACVIHVSCHSFTPELDGEVRNCDVGLLYDPRRPGEVDLCARWRTSLKSCAPAIKVRRNYPYAGKDDGFTTYLRQRFSPAEYVGVELEVNQQHVLKPARGWLALRAALIESFRMALRERAVGRDRSADSGNCFNPDK